ncbi:MAG: phosphoribosylamine--glycine ligase, partial [Candidatus Niyogibacteria bacterium]|nr:phosphoribosylamine--glycine ligase [Candidatus Niyogibacteria bacterium]
MSSKTNVLIVGGGGREHALAWKLRQSPRAGDIYIAPKSAGTRLIAENIFIPIADHQKLATFARHHNVHLAVIGPDKPLADGIVDVFRSYGIPTFGPTKSA